MGIVGIVLIVEAEALALFFFRTSFSRRIDRMWRVVLDVFLPHLCGVHARRHRVGDGEKEGLASEFLSREIGSALLQQLTIVPPHAGIDGDISVEEIGVIDQRVDDHEAGRGMADEDPIGRSRIEASRCGA